VISPTDAKVEDSFLGLLPCNDPLNIDKYVVCDPLWGLSWTLRQTDAIEIDGAWYTPLGDEVPGYTRCLWIDSKLHLCDLDFLCGPTAPNNRVIARVLLDGASDPDYILLICQTTVSFSENIHCGIPVPNIIGTVTYRVARSAFTCLCPVCFEKHSETVEPSTVFGIPEELMELPCKNFPEQLELRIQGNDSEFTGDYIGRYVCVEDPEIDCGGGALGCQYVARDANGVIGGSTGPWEWVGCDGLNACPEGQSIPPPPETPPTSGTDTFTVTCE